MPYELFRLEADGRMKPFRSVMRRGSVDRILDAETEAVFAVDTNSLAVVGAARGFPEPEIVGLSVDEVRARFAPASAVTDEQPATPPPRAAPMPNTRLADFRLAGSAEAFGYFWLFLAGLAMLLSLLVAMFAEEHELWIVLNGLVIAIVLASLGLILRVGAATLRRTLDS